MSDSPSLGDRSLALDHRHRRGWPYGLVAIKSRCAGESGNRVWRAAPSQAAEIDARGRPWPVPFSIDPVLACRGQRVAVLASGDPFWHGAGGSLAAHLAPGEWIAFPAASTFSLAAARLGWRLEEVACLGLHAAPFETLLPHLAPAQRAICLLRDGKAAGDLAAWLTQKGFGASSLCVMESLGGPRERIRTTRPQALTSPTWPPRSRWRCRRQAPQDCREHRGCRTTPSSMMARSPSARCGR